MTVYILAYTAMLLIASYLKKHNVSKNVFCVFVFIMWAVIIGLRHPTMGFDLRYGSTNGYWGMYDIIGKATWREVFNDSFAHYERGYIIFNKVLYIFSKNAQFLLIVTAIITMAAIMWLIYKYSDSPLISVIVYLALPVFLINFSGVRQAIAVAITIFSFRFIKEKRLIPFILMVLLANTFHASAIIFLAAYPVYYVKTQKNILKIGSVLLLPIVYVFRIPIFNVLVSLLGKEETAQATNSFMLLLFFAMIYIFCLVFEEDDPEQIGYRNLFYVACIFQMFSGINNLAMRFGYYFMVYLVLLFPKVINIQNIEVKMLKAKTRQLTMHNNSMIMYGAIFMFFLWWGLNSIRTSSWAETYPHYFYWQ